ncbi:hypothetical protein VL20_1217 [Microcystis panniformis FACHB-1757]|uniref:Uncharacterized protein n=1 Tax=Microcystis panniformis FACHB-1757 TaxID=1638788 RepID=A0A0K1RX62_9CHRO|nr:hypothetical protein VL20_1217 [Microcystis panniformis FACHB-1757]
MKINDKLKLLIGCISIFVNPTQRKRVSRRNPFSTHVIWDF